VSETRKKARGRLTEDWDIFQEGLVLRALLGRQAGEESVVGGTVKGPTTNLNRGVNISEFMMTRTGEVAMTLAARGDPYNKASSPKLPPDETSVRAATEAVN
jgi:hypothetical protein